MPTTKPRNGYFINTTSRPDLKQVIAFMQKKTRINTIAELFCQALYRWYEELKAAK